MPEHNGVEPTPVINNARSSQQQVWWLSPTDYDIDGFRSNRVKVAI